MTRRRTNRTNVVTTRYVHGWEPRVRLPSRILCASVRHTDAFSGVVQRDATIHQSIAAKVATGFELGSSLDQKRVTATRRTAEPNSASCLDRIDGAANQAQSIGAKRETAHRKPMRRAVLLSSRGDRI